MSEAYKNEEVLRQEYWDNELSQKKIGEKYGVSRRTIEYWMKKFEIPRRTPDREKDGTFYYMNGYAKFATTVDGDKKHCNMHRLLAVAEYGFDAVKDKVVHHKNGVKWDNRIENIELMSRQEHQRMHSLEE